MMECPVFKAKILTKSSIKIANASLFEILQILFKASFKSNALEKRQINW